MFLQLGIYKFEGIKLPQVWNGSYATNYAQIPIINGKPVIQKTGEKLIEFDITAEFKDEFCIPADEVKALQLSRINGEILQLTGGDGTNYGRYLITDITTINTRASDNGYISAITCSIKLLEYNTTATTLQQTGLALESSAPTEEIPIASITPLSGQINNNINTGIIKSNEINSQTTASTINYARISTLANDVVTSFDEANSQINETEKIAYRAADLQTTLTDAAAAAQAVKDAADIEDLNDLASANDNLQIAVYSLKGANAPLVAFIGSREGGN
jgi:phage protein U